MEDELILVFGYIRLNCCNLHIPVDISRICLQYFDEIHCWTLIINKSVLNKLSLNQRIQLMPSYYSPQMQYSFDGILKFNRFNKDEIFFILQVIMDPLDKKVYSPYIYIEIYCKELNFEFKAYRSICYAPDDILLNTFSSKLLSLNKLKIKYKIDVVRCYSHYVHYGGHYLNIKPFKIKSNVKHKWYINKTKLSEYKKQKRFYNYLYSNNFGGDTESDKTNNCWWLKMSPYGTKRKYRYRMDIKLTLFQLPFASHSYELSVKCNIEIYNDCTDEILLEYDFVINDIYLGQCRNTIPKLLSLKSEILKNVNSLLIMITIEIIEVISWRGFIEKNKWHKYGISG